MVTLGALTLVLLFATEIADFADTLGLVASYAHLTLAQSRRDEDSEWATGQTAHSTLWVNRAVQVFAPLTPRGADAVDVSFQSTHVTLDADAFMKRELTASTNSLAHTRRVVTLIQSTVLAPAVGDQPASWTPIVAPDALELLVQFLIPKLFDAPRADGEHVTGWFVDGQKVALQFVA